MVGWEFSTACHCERGARGNLLDRTVGDCFVVSLLAMTIPPGRTFPPASEEILSNRLRITEHWDGFRLVSGKIQLLQIDLTQIEVVLRLKVDGCRNRSERVWRPYF
jgi:hypothetical protein